MIFNDDARGCWWWTGSPSDCGSGLGTRTSGGCASSGSGPFWSSLWQRSSSRNSVFWESGFSMQNLKLEPSKISDVPPHLLPSPVLPRGWRLAERWRSFSPKSKNVNGWSPASLLPGVGVSFVFPKVARLDCTGGVEEAALSCKDDSKRSIFPSSPTRLLDRTLAQSLSFIFRLKTISDKNWQSKHLKRRFNGACPWCARSFWVGKGRRERQPFSGLTCTRVQTLVCGNIQNNFPFWQSDYRAIGNWLYNLSRVFPSQLFCRTTGRSACTLMPLLLQTCKNFQIFQVGFL